MTCDFYQLAVPGVAGLTPYNPGKPVEELERELGIRDAIKLASNENPLGAGERARAALAELPDVGRYPDGSGHRLRHALAEHHRLEPDRITLGNGSNDVLELVTRVFVRPGDQVIYSAHAFAVYHLVSQAVGAESVIVPANGYAHDLEAMRAAVTGDTRLMFIANPNNPTGTWCSAEELHGLLQQLPEYVIIVIDEAYFEYGQAAVDYPDCSLWLEEFPNLVVTRTFSKAHGLAGLRIGYALSHPQVADLMNRIRQPFNVNAVALLAAEAALCDSAHIERSVKLNSLGIQQLSEGLDSMGVHYLPSLGNFICIDLEQPAQVVYQALLERGVIVRPVANYGMANHLRITIGLEQENARFLKTLAEVLNAG